SSAASNSDSNTLRYLAWNYLDRLDEDEQVNFKGSAKAFVRSYEFLSAILPYTNVEWEKLSIFLTSQIASSELPVRPLAECFTKEDNNGYGLERHSRSSIFTHDSSGRMAAKRSAYLNGGRQPLRHRSRDEPALLGRQANRTTGSRRDLGRLRTVFCCACRHWHMRYFCY